MAPKTESKKSKLARFLAERSLDYVDESAWAEIAMILSPVSASYLRGLLRESGVRLSPSVEGVNQTSFADLERTLIALASAYEISGALERRSIRTTVITAKDHAKWAVKRLEDDSTKRSAKEEMVLWMKTWLENPVLFSAWVQLRKRTAVIAESLSSEP